MHCDGLSPVHDVVVMATAAQLMFPSSHLLQYHTEPHPLTHKNIFYIPDGGFWPGERISVTLVAASAMAINAFTSSSWRRN